MTDKVTEKVTEKVEPNIDSSQRKYGWKPDLPSNEHNYLMTAHPSVVAQFPKFKFLGNLPPVYDQGRLGSCTANALGGAFQYTQIQQGLEVFTPSRLFIYYNERALEGTIEVDSGASLSDGIKSMIDLGVCSELIWPYDISRFTEKPSELAFKDASDHQVLASRRVPISANAFKTMINMGYPIAFGFTVFNFFESPQMAKTGVLKLPGFREKPLGGHAVLCVGYSDTMKSGDGKYTGYLKIRNSWGSKWGVGGGNQTGGYFWMPYKYLESGLCDDAWVITKNEGQMVKLNKQMSEKIKLEDVVKKLTE
jgi:C1A family cysteine protease